MLKLPNTIRKQITECNINSREKVWILSANTNGVLLTTSEKGKQNFYKNATNTPRVSQCNYK